MTAYDHAFRKFQADYFYKAVAEHNCDAAAAAEAIGVHRNTISRVLNDAGYPLSRIRRIQSGLLPADERKPVKSESLLIPMEKRISA